MTKAHSPDSAHWDGVKIIVVCSGIIQLCVTKKICDDKLNKSVNVCLPYLGLDLILRAENLCALCRP